MCVDVGAARWRSFGCGDASPVAYLPTRMLASRRYACTPAVVPRRLLRDLRFEVHDCGQDIRHFLKL